ncbi:MAG: PorT family protein [Bacteroidales bacterium]|nr:PorT family protein [Bacteroidales bacterium]
MKLKFLIFFFIIIKITNAQTELGVKIGGGSSSVDFRPKIEQQNINTFTTGLVFKHINKPIVGIQLELNYIQKGWKEIIDTLHFYKRSVNYIEFPVLTHFHIGKNKLGFFINIGPDFAYHIKSKGDEYTKSQYSREYFYKDIKKFEYSLVFDLGFKLKTNVGCFQLEGRYIQALTNFLDSEIITDSRNKFIGVSLVYLYQIKSYTN